MRGEWISFNCSLPFTKFPFHSNSWDILVPEMALQVPSCPSGLGKLCGVGTEVSTDSPCKALLSFSQVVLVFLHGPDSNWSLSNLTYSAEAGLNRSLLISGQSLLDRDVWIFILCTVRAWPCCITAHSTCRWYGVRKVKLHKILSR